MLNAAERRVSPIFRALNRPLTILGVERRLFFLALAAGGAVFSLLHSLLGAIGLFLAGLVLGRVATTSDAEILRVLLNAGKLRGRYDPLKSSKATVQIARRNSED